MERTQIILNTQLKRELVIYSREHSKSISQILREIASQFLSQQKRQVGVKGLLQIAGMAGSKGPRNLSKQVDKILYS